MITVKADVTDIQWDTDNPGELESLPKEMNVTVTLDIEEGDIEDGDVDQAVSDAITEKTGFCHKGFDMVYDVLRTIYVSPQGKEVCGTDETIKGQAFINPETLTLKDGKLVFEYGGETDISWDTQTSVIENGERVFVDEEGNTFPESQLHYLDPANGITEPTPVWPDRIRVAVPVVIDSDRGVRIDGAMIEGAVFDDEMVNYKLIERGEMIQDLCDWIGEAKGAERDMMLADLVMICGWEDEYIWSSITTNEYLSPSKHREDFNAVCTDVLAANEALRME